jgi:UDP-N-acetylglucosamine:LPS N-acetylglucosamine transferase
MRKILILTAGFGNGHNAAAFALRDGFKDVAEDVQVEVLDLFKQCYGARNDAVTGVFLAIVNRVPGLWALAYRVIHRTTIAQRLLRRFHKLRCELFQILETMHPDAVVSTYPAYNHILDQIFEGHKDRPFQTITVVTDSISVNSIWHTGSSDACFVANDLTAQVLREAGVPAEKVHACGFPVSPWFYELAQTQLTPVVSGQECKRVLYMTHQGRRTCGPVIERLLKLPDIELTIVCGSQPALERELIARTAHAANRVRVFGWTDRMPELLASSHLVISKAGGALVQEAIAARCPLIVNRIIPGQEEGNAELVRALGIGDVAESDEAVIELVRNVFKNDGALWWLWKSAISRHSRPEAALRVAEGILQKVCDAELASARPAPVGTMPEGAPVLAEFPAVLQSRRQLLCDFHTHTTFSDGRLALRELVDFYGARGFDCVCVTDHVAEKSNAIGRIANLSGLVVPWGMLDEYFEAIARQRQRAWAKYGMILMAGLEFNKDGLSKHSSAHLLAVDLQRPIAPDVPIKPLIEAIHQQGGLAVAAHPHLMRRWGDRDTLYLWKHQEEFAPLLDAWEIANRDEIFNPVGLRRLPYIANSDFHKPKHIYSWKTMLDCEKHPDAIKACIRENRNISITLFRDANAPVSLRTDRPLVFAPSAARFNEGQLTLPFAA